MVGCDEAVGDGKSKRCLTLVELELDTCRDWHPCSSPGSLKHYLDDFLIIFSPSMSLDLANQAVDWIQALGNQLGPFFQDEKTLHPSTQVEFLSLKLDTLAMEACLLGDKLLYLRNLLLEWLDHCSCSLLDL